MKNSGSFWFWVLPPLLLLGVYAAYRFYFAERLFGPQEQDASPPPAEQIEPATDKPYLPPTPGPAQTRPTQQVTENPPALPEEIPPATDEQETPITDLSVAESLLPRLAQTITANRTALLWAANENLLRHVVGAVDCVANGVSPRMHIGFFSPQGPFRAARGTAGLIVDPASYARYDIVADVVESIDVEGCRQTYARLEPVLEKLYRDLGYPTGSFRASLGKAVAVMLATPTPPVGAGLKRSGSNYIWADPALERMNEAQKHLLRMGPDNVRRIKAKLRQIAAALKLTLPQ
jgi:hypothetical protein